MDSGQLNVLNLALKLVDCVGGYSQLGVRIVLPFLLTSVLSFEIVVLRLDYLKIFGQMLV